METENPGLAGGSRELKAPAKIPGDGKETGPEKEAKKEFKSEKLDLQNEKVLTAIPVLFITLAEILLYSGKAGAAIWVHVGTVIALTFSTVFVKDKKINRIHQALTLLPILRLINLSMPVFSEVALYSFITIYGPLAIPVAMVAKAQNLSREQMGIVFDKKLWLHLPLAIPLGFLLGYGEYSTIHTGYFIPDLSFMNVLKLTIIMVFFVGLMEEVIFRSVLQTRLEETFGAKNGMIAASLLFGLMHSGYGTPYEMFYTAFVGLFMGYTFQKTRSLPFITVLHGFVNVFLFGIIPHIMPSASFF